MSDCKEILSCNHKSTWICRLFLNYCYESSLIFFPRWNKYTLNSVVGHLYSLWCLVWGETEFAMRVMHWREKAGVFCGFTLLPSAGYMICLGNGYGCRHTGVIITWYWKWHVFAAMIHHKRMSVSYFKYRLLSFLVRKPWHFPALLGATVITLPPAFLIFTII